MCSINEKIYSQLSLPIGKLQHTDIVLDSLHDQIGRVLIKSTQQYSVDENEFFDLHHSSIGEEDEPQSITQKILDKLVTFERSQLFGTFDPGDLFLKDVYYRNVYSYI